MQTKHNRIHAEALQLYNVSDRGVDSKVAAWRRRADFPSYFLALMPRHPAGYF